MAGTTPRTPPPPGRRLELRPEELRRTLDPASLRFRTTAEVKPLVGTIGQPRALEAIAYGLDQATPGFNLFVAGSPGSGRRSTVLDYVRDRAARRPIPDDWVYVHSFRAPDRPNAIRLPAGMGVGLAADMDEFVVSARREIPRAFESEDYARRRREVLAEAGARQEQLEAELTQFAAERGFAVKVDMTGVVSIPLIDGKPITREDFERLDEARREAIARAGSEIEERTATAMHRLHDLAKQAAVKLAELDREVALFATGPLFRELEERYRTLPEVLAHLESLKQEMVAHLDDFRGGESEGDGRALLGLPQRHDLSAFRVNVLVDNSHDGGAPVVVEQNPTYYNLLGRVEYRATFGAVTTDFREIKPGAVHRANGGFLVLDVLDVIRHPFAWDGLKRALRTGELRIENLAEEIAATPSASLRPEPIPVAVKVVLIGSPAVYHLLYALDEEFRELFKVKAQFSPELEWTREHHRNYAAFVSRWVAENGLLHFDRAAVARLIEHGARLRESRHHLSARLIDISDVVSEASFWARRRSHPHVRADDVERAIREREYRSNLLEERVRKLIADGTIVIATRGGRVGELNGLAVLDLGDHSFGRPTRVSARVALGRGSVVSIEREIELSGPIHSKGVLTIAGYLAATYAQDDPLSLAASLSFEQSYDEVEGDSASAAELLVLLSALAELPLDQGIAVTGSVDQHGAVQAIGGVNQKVEGFYATCKTQGLTGSQGVVIPSANAKNLMLDPEVVEAVRAGRFHVWAVRTIDEALWLTTGIVAGRRRRSGPFPEGTVHARVAARLAAYAERIASLGERAPHDGGD
jgi:lon-related putative ATP-dependent protease